jgi:hypothetical protein
MSRRRHEDFPHGPSRKIPAKVAGRQGGRTPQCVSNAAHPTPGSTKAQRRGAATDRTGPYPDPLQPVEAQDEAERKLVRVVVAGLQDVLVSERGKAKRIIPRNEGSRSTWLNIAKMTRCRAVVGAQFCDPKHVSF